MKFDLNRIPPKLLFITNIIVILLLMTSTIFLIAEIHYVKKHGGQCVNNPMGWAEKYAREERGEIIQCRCEQSRSYFNLHQINLTEIKNE